MSHAWVPDGKLWTRLLEVDEELADRVRSGGCDCGGRLDRADYPRKPRGDLADLEDRYLRRISFCCAVCRRRTTPPSTRFLGRKVYVGAVVIAACVRLLSGAAGALGVPPRTVGRWLAFWQGALTTTSFWRAAQGLLMPPVVVDNLPASLLDRLGGLCHDGIERTLRFVSPITTGSARTAVVVP